MRLKIPRHLIALIAAAAMTAGTASRTAADGHGVALFLGGALVGAAINDARNKNKPRPRANPGHVVNNSAVAATRAENREVQTALNYFDFPAGTPDGVLGRKYRTAATEMQVYLGHPVSGKLTDFERDILLGAYQRGIAGNAETYQLIAASPDGARALLLAQRDMLTGTTTLATSEEPPNTLPVFAAPADTASASALCAKLNLMGSENALVDAAASADPGAAAGALLCSARDSAIADGDALALQLQVTPAQADAQCAPYGTALAEHVGALSLKPRAQVIRDVSDFVAGSGLDAAQLSTTAEVCLASGYRLDDLDLALGSGLLLTALGQAPYGELMGHHLALGLGTSERTDLALDWYDAALTALDGGATEVFADDTGTRHETLRATAVMLAGGAVEPLKPVEASLPKTKLSTIGSAKKSK